MVGIVIVSHSYALAKSILELARLMAPVAPMAMAGGLPDGSFGSDFQSIKEAIECVKGPDGVVILMDMGSSVMTTEMVLEELNDSMIKMSPAPIVEGAIAASTASENKETLQEILDDLLSIKMIDKF